MAKTLLATPPTTGPLTADDILKMDGLFELLDVQLAEKQRSFLSGNTAGIVSSILVPFIQKKRLGALSLEATFCCFPNNPNQVRRPDLAFISAARLSKVPDEGHVPIAPDLAIEIVSSGDSVYDLDDKLVDYRAAGIPLVWILNPHTRIMRSFRPGKPIEELSEFDQLTADEVLPNFKIQVSDLFPPPKVRK